MANPVDSNVAETEGQAQDLRLSGVQKSFGALKAVHGIDIDVPAGSMVSLIGPSGCGKTTTLRMIAGLETLNAGRITVGGVTLSGDGVTVPPEKRDMGMVFQSYALWPHMNVADNVGYGLRRKGLGQQDVIQRVAEVLDMVGMSDLGTRYPGQLSGGQQQRVALARAIASRPRILLFDEPLSNLDAVLREQMRFEIRNLQQRLGITSVYVTHSQEEALALSDHIVVMNAGLVAQAGSPTEIYDTPRNAFVAGFIGLTNILTLNGLHDDGAGLAGTGPGGTLLRSASGAVARHQQAQTCQVSVRPSEIRLMPADAAIRDGQNRLSGTVTATVFTGGVVDTFVAVTSSPETIVRVQSTPPVRAKSGDAVILEFDPARTVALED
ncbi:iron(III) transport system ATP-binding protein [Roseicitreum antarcticum]|uniref:Iron(III) transport system ATP-binding protein n=2 Tax=Roseicitreum antarcticum TaxID=564137 RepID=A0A1H2YJK0_9RHOB|nr:iron(III) transport system ATP-binding protein [Roseicitreum antarcticum]